MLLKSPTNSLRVRTLHRLFPDAVFVLIVRSPQAVFTSTVSMWQRMWERYAISEALGVAELEDQVLRLRLVLEQRLEADLEALSPASHLAVKYEDLVADAAGTIRTLFDKFDLGDHSTIVPRVARYMETRQRQMKDISTPAPKSAQLRERWASVFDKYDYR
ncbi:MAG: sulfotransferase family protein [Candidatus Binataceae bacterium]